jgi:hypothetical protein
MAFSTNYKENASGVLQPILPILSFKEKEHVIYYYNKSCFHAKEYFKRIWLDKNQQKMPLKSKGWLIYCSDFISLKGRLVISQKNAREIIYLGGSQKTPY